MKEAPIGIRAIKQLDNHTFQIDWSDGTQGQYRLSELQKNCPCANCVDEVTGERRAKSQRPDNDVRAIKIQSLGRYALKVQFTQGCSTGIYSYQMLHAIAQSSKGLK